MIQEDTDLPKMQNSSLGRSHLTRVTRGVLQPFLHSVMRSLSSVSTRCGHSAHQSNLVVDKKQICLRCGKDAQRFAQDGGSSLASVRVGHLFQSPLEDMFELGDDKSEAAALLAGILWLCPELEDHQRVALPLAPSGLRGWER